jgi:hypothetical protein
MNTDETSEDRELTVSELDLVSGGGMTDENSEMLLCFGLVGVALYLTTGKLNAGLHRN